MTRKIPNSRWRAKAAKPRKHGEILLPADDQIERWRQKLQSASARPIFGPVDTQQLLEQGRTLSGDGETTVDDAVEKLVAERLKAQTAELVKALGLDLNERNVWRDAFGYLAVIHYGAGRLVHRLPTGDLDDDRLLDEVALMQRHGYSKSEAIRKLAAEGEFPYEERRDEERRDRRKRRDERSEREQRHQNRVSALRQRFMRAQRREKRRGPRRARSFVDAFALGADSRFEKRLRALNPPPLPEED